MPNHVFNKLRISGKKDAIEKLKPLISSQSENGSGIDFNILIPEPDYENIEDSEDETESKSLFSFFHKMPLWYRWRCEHWGTKWNAYDSTLRDGENFVEVCFLTAWSCPVPWLHKVGEECEKLGISLEGVFADEDCGGCNYGTICGGYCTYDVAAKKKEIYEECWGIDIDKIDEELNDTEDEKEEQ